jgi:ABC-type Zn uptake system ZnuABC Zn-binding protein ZnuA
LITLIRSSGVRVIFTERGYSPRLIQSVAREAGVRIAELDTLEMGTPSAGAYLEGMEANARAVAGALAGSAPGALTVATGR